MTEILVNRILVVGAGGVGLIFAGHLSQLDQVHVSIAARSNFAAIESDEISVKRPHNEALSYTYRPEEVFDSLSDLPYGGEPFDFIVISSKSMGTKALPGLDRFIDRNRTMIFLLQNGINIENPYLRDYPGIALSSAVVKVAAELTKPREVTFFNDGMNLDVGLVYSDPSSADYFKNRLASFVDITKKAGITTVVSDNIIKARWRKLMWNATFNTLTSITDLPTGGLFAAGMEPLAEKIMLEVWKVGGTVVGEKDWIPVSNVYDLIEYTKTKIPAGFLPSTLQDVRRGNEIEIEAIVGNAIRAAKEHNVPVPSLEFIYGLLKGINHRIKEKNSQI